MTMLGFLVGGLLGSKFGSKKTLTVAVAVGTLMTVACPPRGHGRTAA